MQASINKHKETKKKIERNIKIKNWCKLYLKKYSNWKYKMYIRSFQNVFSLLESGKLWKTNFITIIEKNRIIRYRKLIVQQIINKKYKKVIIVKHISIYLRRKSFVFFF